MINSLQLFVHLPLFDINMPASAQILVEKLLHIAHFDIIENSDALGWLINFPEEDENLIYGNYQDAGYESAYTINLLGTGFLFISALCLIMVLLLITIPITRWIIPFRKPHEKVKRSIFWSVWIRFIIEESLVALITVFCALFNSNQCHGSECTSAVDVLET